MAVFDKVTLFMDCFHQKTVPADVAESIFIHDYTFCSRCGKKRKIVKKEFVTKGL